MEYFCSIKPEFRKIVNNRSCGNLITPLCYMECFAEYLGFSSFHEMEYFFYIKRDLCSDLYTTGSFIDAMCIGGDVIRVKNFMFDTMELSRSMIIHNWRRTLY
jgi:hypothetical protein